MEFDFENIKKLLSIQSKEELNELRNLSYNKLTEFVGECVYLRGLIEFSNYCSNDCYYCGIRKGNTTLERYYLTREEILDCAKIALELGYGSIVLQSGENNSEKNINFISEVISEIKEISKSELLPNGLGITLSIGELSYQNYEKLYKAGAHRYLLRIETSNPTLFKKIHPVKQTFERRLECLNYLREIGYQVGTGVMIGIPEQTIDDLTNDILFFKEQDVDMIGMGPFIPHKDTIYCDYYIKKPTALQKNYLLSLKMIAAARLVMKDINIASTTALETIHPSGWEEGLKYGANVIMPNITPFKYRKKYQLYDNKPCSDISPSEQNSLIKSRIEAIGRKICYNEWGDSKHYWQRKEKNILINKD